MGEDIRGKCHFCNWAKYNWCSTKKRVSNPGTCLDWKPDKLSDAAREKQADIQKAAHARDRDRIAAQKATAHKIEVEKRKATRAKRDKSAKGGA